MQQLSYTFRPGEFVCVCGPSGIGKTTILQLIAGLEKPDAGVIHRSSDKIGYVFQEPRLIPWCSVAENIELSLYHLFPDEKAKRRTISETLVNNVGLDGFEHYYPSQLSGGMKQRVSLARAFAVEPDILLLDEPFSSLNAELRESMCEYLLKLLSLKFPATVMVTHNIEDAVRIADRIIFLRNRPCEIVLDLSLEEPVEHRDMKFRLEQIDFIQTQIKCLF